MLNHPRRAAASSKQLHYQPHHHDRAPPPPQSARASLFDLLYQEQIRAAAAAAAASEAATTPGGAPGSATAVAAASDQLTSDEEDGNGDGDGGGGGAGAAAAKITYVGFSVCKIRQELFQAWLSDRADLAQYRCADLVAVGAVDAVFAELLRLSCLCAHSRPQLMLEVARERARLERHFAAAQRAALARRAVAFFGPGGSAGGSASIRAFEGGGGGAKKRKRATGGGGVLGGGAGDALARPLRWARFRNSAELRRPLARLVLLAYLSADTRAQSPAAAAPPPFVPQDEYSPERLRERVEADRATWARSVLRADEDPPQVTVAANELVFQLQSQPPLPPSARDTAAGQRRLAKVIYWAQWLAFRRGVVCAARGQFGEDGGGAGAGGGAGGGPPSGSGPGAAVVGRRKASAAHTHPVWIAWEALLQAARRRRDGGGGGGGGAGGASALAMLDVLCAEFRRDFRPVAMRQRLHLLCCAAAVALFGADWSAPLAEASAAEIDRRADFDASAAYRVLRIERATVVAAKRSSGEYDVDYEEEEEEGGGGGEGDDGGGGE